jgi:hypothetical protein
MKGKRGFLEVLLRSRNDGFNKPSQPGFVLVANALEIMHNVRYGFN